MQGLHPSLQTCFILDKVPASQIRPCVIHVWSSLMSAGHDLAPQALQPSMPQGDTKDCQQGFDQALG